MNYTGKKVVHTKWGDGLVLTKTDTTLTVVFSIGVKVLAYPLCFQMNVLSTEDAQLKKEVDELIQLQSLNEQDILPYDHLSKTPKQPKNQIKKVSLSHYEDLSQEQKQTFDLMENTSENLFITGKAGTGKTFLLNAFKKATKKQYLLLAPTGKSALNIGGVTIHSAFGFKNIHDINIDNLNSVTVNLTSKQLTIFKVCDVIIIDEISMVSSDQFEKIDKILKIACKNKLPFGGKQILVFGDLFQLPPVITSEDERNYYNERYGGIYFINTTAYKLGKFKFIQLKDNQRQKDNQEFFEILNQIRLGHINYQQLELLNKRANYDKKDVEDVVTIFAYRRKVEQFNNLKLNQLAGKEFIFESDIDFNDNVENKNINIGQAFPIDNQLRLKVGALVMFVNNDLGKRWVNGTVGNVTYLSDDLIKVKVDNNEYEVTRQCFSLQNATLKNNQIVYEDYLTVTQFPVILAYAMTIHKAQGMTCERIVCDVSRCFEQGQLYVALSRCKSLNGLYLLYKLNKDSLKVDKKILDFYMQNE